MYFERQGSGKKLLLIHGLGGSWKSWSTIFPALTAERDVIAIDLPGFGQTPPLSGDVSVPALADAVAAFLDAQNLQGVDAVGSSMGGRLVLELARRGEVGNVVSLDPGGFWEGWQKTYFATTIGASIKLVRALQPVMPGLCRSAAGRTMLFPQFSPRPWALPAEACLQEMRDYAAAASFDPLLHSLIHGPEQQGAAAGATPQIVIGWGRQDRITLPSQSEKALRLFPGARLHWFESCGHFPHWDKPEEATRLILDATG